MKALLIYSKKSGRRNFCRFLSLVHQELDSQFESLDCLCPATKEESYLCIKNAYLTYDVLIVVGGDGTLNNALNAMMQNEKRPILGYINNGTLGDAGKLFGVTKNVRRALKIIKEGHIEYRDVGEISVQGHKAYFSYMAAVGVFSDVSYQCNKGKKIWGKFSYYWRSFIELFDARKINYQVKDVAGSASFVMVLNGSHVGGFHVNKFGLPNDGKMEFYASKGKAFNGLLSYVSQKNVNKFSDGFYPITLNGENLTWCLDGEEFLSGDAVIACCPKAIQVFCVKKCPQK